MSPDLLLLGPTEGKDTWFDVLAVIQHGGLWHGRAMCGSGPGVFLTVQRAYVLADNKLAANAGWDADILAIELQAPIDLEFDVEITGFSAAEIDLALDFARDRKPERPDPADRIPETPATPVTRVGDGRSDSEKLKSIASRIRANGGLWMQASGGHRKDGDAR